jgi:hypothetical protein
LKLVHGAMCSNRKNRRNSADACERGCAEMENRTGRHGELDIAVSSAAHTGNAMSAYGSTFETSTGVSFTAPFKG